MDALLSEVLCLPKKQQGRKMVDIGRKALIDSQVLQLVLQLGASPETTHRLLALDACMVGKSSADMQQLAMRLWQDSASTAVRSRAADVLLIICPSEHLLNVSISNQRPWMPLAYVHP
jgi:hypothetical protein